MAKRDKAQVLVEPNRRGTTRSDATVRTGLTLAAVLATSLLVAFWLYRHALAGPFLFDDIGLPFYQPSFPHESFKAWISGVRPVVFLTYYLNYQLSGRDTWSYHALSIVIHAVNSTLVFALMHGLLMLTGIAGRRAVIVAITGALVFLVHPLQSESVAYIAGRSELVCGFFTLAALVLFCRAGSAAMSWQRAAGIVVCYGCAVLSKEQAVVLPVLLFALDLALYRRSVAQTLRHNAWLYAPLAIVAVLGAAAVTYVLSASMTAGFNVAGLQWYEYLFTQTRVWLHYIRLAILPLGQSADYDIELSRTILEHGAALAALVLLAAMLWVARARVRYPLLFCGALIFAALLLPTSSFVPLRDLAAERRMYLPLVGLLVAGAQFLSRVRTPELTGTAIAAYVVFLCVLTQGRATVWGSDVALWTDVTRSSPMKPRGYTHLAYAYLRTGRCNDAVNAIRSAQPSVQEDAVLLAVLGQAYACVHRLDEAAVAYERAILAEPSVGRMLALAFVYKRANRIGDAASMESNALRYPARTAYDESMLQSLRTFRSRSGQPETQN